MGDEHLDLRPHQQKALRKLSNGKILWGGVGTGKSRVAAAYYHLNEAPKHVYIITTAKKRDSFDWQEEFYRLGIGPATGPVLEASGKGVGRGGRRGSKSDVLPGDGEPDRNCMVGRPDEVRAAVQISRNPERGSDISAAERDGQGSIQEPPVYSGGIPSSDSTVLGSNGGRGSSTQGNSFDNGSAGIYPWVLTVDSWNNIAKYADVAGAFFVFDEQRLVGSGDWTRKFLRIAKRNNWILLSGTPGDTWMDYIPVFVANDFYKNRTSFKREHVVYNTFTKFPKVDRYINVGKLLRQRAQLLVEMPYERHTKRRTVEVPMRFDKEALEMVLKKRWHIYENRPLRDIAEMFAVGRKVVNSDRSRIEMVQELWQKHPKLIIFYNFNYELEILRSLQNHYEIGLHDTSNLSGRVQTKSAGTSTTTPPMSATSTSLVEGQDPRWMPTSSTKNSETKSSDRFDKASTNISKKNPDGTNKKFFDTSQKMISSTSMYASASTTNHEAGSIPTNGFRQESGTTVSIAEWNGHKHQPIPSTDRWLYLVQYTAGAEGWNCVETDAMIMYSRNYSWKIFEQACGRIDRLNTPFKDLWYYDFMSESFIDLAIGRSLKAKESFNEAKYARLFTS